MKRFLLAFSILVIFVLMACGKDEPTVVDARAIFELDRVYLDDQETDVSKTNYVGSRLTFIGEENGGNVIMRIGDIDVQASINPSREHPSFESGYWHHHLYSSSTEAGSPRINFKELLPSLGIDDNDEATDHTQSDYQRGNLHYVVESGEFRLRFIINGAVHDLMFTQL